MISIKNKVLYDYTFSINKHIAKQFNGGQWKIQMMEMTNNEVTLFSSLIILEILSRLTSDTITV